MNFRQDEAGGMSETSPASYRDTLKALESGCFPPQNTVQLAKRGCLEAAGRTMWRVPNITRTWNARLSLQDSRRINARVRHGTAACEMLHRKVSAAWLLTAMGDMTHDPGLQDCLLGRARRHVLFLFFSRRR